MDRPDREFLWLSERDGWRHIYKVSRTGGSPNAHHARRLRRDPDPGRSTRIRPYVYFTASPDNATQKYLYSCRPGRPRTASSLNPKDQPGTHDYEVSPDGRWAVHHYSTANTPPVVELVRLPSARARQAVRR